MVLPRGRGGIEPAGSAILRSIKGFESFNDATECLEMLKGGFGLIDAPNLVAMKADKVLKQENIKPTISDLKIYLKFENGKLMLMVSTHIDDYKATGERPTLIQFHKMLQKHFGNDAKLNMEESFIHTGIRHR
eukprot:7872279-Pyramimonas_sp.AAC.1